MIIIIHMTNWNNLCLMNQSLSRSILKMLLFLYYKNDHRCWINIKSKLNIRKHLPRPGTFHVFVAYLRVCVWLTIIIYNHLQSMQRSRLLKMVVASTWNILNEKLFDKHYPLSNTMHFTRLKFLLYHMCMDKDFYN